MNTILDLLLRHDCVTQALTRPPGTPPSQCTAPLARVGPDGREIPWDSPGAADECQAGEGGLRQHVELYLFRCRRDGATLVVARCPDGTWRLRNDSHRDGA